jgi:hypothetical protein
MNQETVPTIRHLYPDLSDIELLEAEETLERYLAVVLRIYERLAQSPGSSKLTPSDGTVSYTPPEQGASWQSPS